MPIRNTGKLITDCWLRAEQSLREVVKKKFRDRDEEIITELFRAELETEFATASEKGTVERAFLEDLKQAFQHVRMRVFFVGVGFGSCFEPVVDQADNGSERARLRED